MKKQKNFIKKQLAILIFNFFITKQIGMEIKYSFPYLSVAKLRVINPIAKIIKATYIIEFGPFLSTIRPVIGLDINITTVYTMKK